MLNVSHFHKQLTQMIETADECLILTAFFFSVLQTQCHRMPNEAYANFTHDSFCFA